ncbi:MAG: glycoside hydrolase family 32 protein [Bacteroidales bacterium]|jgi:sucrose-6-phosphate hydrolase SacC (GH32 family)|nr:glycoside hydrolase family 32 protein [Bacteroidales bacterium]
MKYLSIIFAGTILALTLTSAKPEKDYYSETYRPQFHFSPETGRHVTTSGLLYYDSEYHMFYQYLPNNANNSADLEWGHASSKNMVNWKHNPVTFNAENCKILSSSIIIDENNTLGKQTGAEKTLLMFNISQSCGLRIAYSTNKGIMWNNLEKNPVMPHSEADNMRDPNIFWHEQTQKWIMVLNREINDNSRGASIYSSNNLINWEWESDIANLKGTPSLVSIKVANRPEETKWILFDEDGSYIIGDFDGETFSPETAKAASDYGINYFAPKTWNYIPAEDGRIIQIAWMNGENYYPNMPFSGQMTFPAELKINKLNSEYKLTKLPVREIASLHGKHHNFTDKNIIPGLNYNPLKNIKGECFHIIAEFDVKTSNNFGFMIRNGRKDIGTEILYNVTNETLSVFGTTVPVQLIDNKISIEILIDRASIEVFANGGQVTITNNFTPVEGANGYILYNNGGELMIKKMDIYAINTAWGK